MTFATFALRRVVSFGPEGMLDRLSGVLDERLTKEFGAEVPPPDPRLFTASLDDRCDAGEAQQIIDARPAAAVCTQCGQQPRTVNRAGARKRIEDKVVSMCLAERFDLSVKLRDRIDGRLHLRGEGFDHQDRGGDDGAVSCQRHGFFD